MKIAIAVLLIAVLLVGCRMETDQVWDVEQYTEGELLEDQIPPPPDEPKEEDEEDKEEPTDPGQNVTFPDANLEAVIRETLEKPEGDIYTSDLERITRIYAPNRGIVDLSGIEYCVNVRDVSLARNQIVDITPLGELPGGNQTWVDGEQTGSYTRLSLGLTENQITDISPLAKLAHIDELGLSLGDNPIGDISALQGLTNLIGLGLRRTRITDISALSGMDRLNNLEIWGNSIVDISPLAGLSSLVWLELSSNKVKDMTPLSRLPKLESVLLRSNRIETLPDLTGMTSLGLLDLRNNLIVDASRTAELADVVVKLEGNPCYESAG